MYCIAAMILVLNNISLFYILVYTVNIVDYNMTLVLEIANFRSALNSYCLFS